jgi:4-diphosphocytidyl-2-C-methyl-D-erythritol kinase
MAASRVQRPIRIRAHAKLNLTLRVLGVRPDGYHELRTTFQTLALHDTLTVASVPGPLTIDCDEPACPRDRSNLVWAAAERLWRSMGKRGAVSGVRIAIAKRIPMQAGLGGGSSDAAAALRALAVLWGAPHTAEELRALGRDLGADVPFFFDGGTALGLERGDLIFPLLDCEPAWVVLVMPPFGVNTRDAYAWWDAEPRSAARAVGRPSAAGLPVPVSELVNDLQPPVVAQHPRIGRLIAGLRRAGAAHAAMSGSGSAVFGLFGTERQARAAASVTGRAPVEVVITSTVSRRQHHRRSAPRFT